MLHGTDSHPPAATGTSEHVSAKCFCEGEDGNCGGVDGIATIPCQPLVAGVRRMGTERQERPKILAAALRNQPMPLRDRACLLLQACRSNPVSSFSKLFAHSSNTARLLRLCLVTLQISCLYAALPPRFLLPHSKKPLPASSSSSPSPHRSLSPLPIVRPFISRKGLLRNFPRAALSSAPPVRPSRFIAHGNQRSPVHNPHHRAVLLSKSRARGRADTDSAAPSAAAPYRTPCRSTASFTTFVGTLAAVSQPSQVRVLWRSPPSTSIW